MRKLLGWLGVLLGVGGVLANPANKDVIGDEARKGANTAVQIITAVGVVLAGVGDLRMKKQTRQSDK